MGVRPFTDLMQAGDQPPAVPMNPAEDLVALPYSSGTTGLPKGVMLTHRNLVANLCQAEGMRNFECFGERDITMAVLPFFHIYGMVVIMMLGLAGGGTILVMPRFDMMEFLTFVQKYRVTILPLVPPIVLGLVKHPAVAQFDLSSVRLIFSGAAPLGEEMARALSAKLGCPVVQGYGMTEASPVTHLSPTHDEPFKPGSAGKIVPNTEVKIVEVGSGGDAELPVGKEGELWIRGPQIMKGYLNRPEETAGCLDRDGWYHTGDVGYVDDDGYFFIVDRTKELIKYKGMQVAPAELEALLLTHPAILDAAVVRKADEEAGEVPKAYVVLKPDDVSKAIRRGRHHGLGRPAGRPAQAHPPSRVHRPDPEVGLRQDPAPGADRPREVALGDEPMNKIERVRAALAGRPVDRAPFTVWYHFGNQHAPAERTAQVHLEFFEHYDLDLLKLMNDYDYPMPAGMEVLASAADLGKLAPFDPARTPFGTQLQTVELVARALRDRALFVDTVFNAWNTLKRNLVREAMPALMAEQPKALEAALAVVNDNLIRYAQASLARGAAGIFFSVPATAESLTLPQYERFMRPFDLAFLKAIEGRGECHVLHAHGERLYFDRLVDYPVHALSWADLNGGPSLAEARRRTRFTLMSGLDHVKFVESSARLVRGQVARALDAGGTTGFILAPGCSLPTFAYPPLIRAARDESSGRAASGLGEIRADKG